MQDYEKLRAFYQGQLYDLEQGARHDDLIIYNANDLTTHAMSVGMTGSRKIGLVRGLIEAAASELDRIESGFDAHSEPFEEVTIAPHTGDIDIHFAGLGWAPRMRDGQGRLVPAWI